MPRRNVLDQKVISDSYEFLHFVEQGKSSMQELLEIFGQPGNKAESDYRQVERIKQRCIKAGIFLEFDNINMRFRTERNAKLKYLDSMLPKLEEQSKRNYAFGFYVEKVSTKENSQITDYDIE